MTAHGPETEAGRFRPVLGSLTGRLMLAFALVSVVGIGLAALLAHQVTVRQFEAFFRDKNRAEYMASAADYHARQGSWAGVDAYFRQSAPRGPGQRPAPPAFGLADAQGVVVSPAEPYRVGQRLPPDTIARAQPVVEDRLTVGLVVDAVRAPQLTDREAAYLATTNRALSLAALGAVTLALLLGAVLARGLTRPVRDLTHAVEAVAHGELRQEVPVRSSDELGDLTRAFNQMSADLARANDLRRQMTADIAHDLRTPLTVITGYIEGLRDGVLRPTPERFEVMHTEAQHLKRLVEDLRTLSLADAGELPLHRRPVAPAAMLDRAVAAYRHRAEQSSITLSAHDEAGTVTVDVDEERMAQVLGNLVGNALRHTPGGGHVTLSATTRADWVELAVSDDGEGISPDDLPRVFDRFYRADAARQGTDGETGLGLAIARSIVVAHGGTIAVASEEGRGTEVVVTLPGGRDRSAPELEETRR
jgi:signal transduction histidine kinase